MRPTLRPSALRRGASCIPATPSPIPGLSAIVLTADGEHIAAVPGVKPAPNPYCATEPHWDLDTTENPRSAGILSASANSASSISAT